MPSAFIGSVQNAQDMLLVVTVMMVAVGMYVVSKHALAKLARKSVSSPQAETKKLAEDVILSAAKKNTAAAKKRRNRNKARRERAAQEEQDHMSNADAVRSQEDLPDLPMASAKPAVAKKQQNPAGAAPAAAPQAKKVEPVVESAAAAPATPAAAASSTKDDSFAAIAAVAALAVMTDVTIALKRPEITSTVITTPSEPATPLTRTFGEFKMTPQVDVSVAPSEVSEDDYDNFESMPALLDEEEWSFFSSPDAEYATENSAPQEAAHAWDPLSDAFDTMKALNGFLSNTPDVSLRGSSSASISDSQSARTSIYDPEDVATSSDSDDDSVGTLSSANVPSEYPSSDLSSFFTRNLPLNYYQTSNSIYEVSGSNLPRIHLQAAY